MTAAKTRGDETRSNVMALMRHSEYCSFVSEDYQCSCPSHSFVAKFEHAILADLLAAAKAAIEVLDPGGNMAILPPADQGIYGRVVLTLRAAVELAEGGAS